MTLSDFEQEFKKTYRIEKFVNYFLSMSLIAVGILGSVDFIELPFFTLKNCIVILPIVLSFYYGM